MLGKVEKSLGLVHQGLTSLEGKFSTHVHQPIEVRGSSSDAPPEPAAPEAAKTEGAPAPAPAPTPEASAPPPAPKVVRGIGPLHRHGKKE